MNPQGTVAPIGFCIAGASYAQLCDALAKLPEVRFTSRRRFFMFAAGIRAEFGFRDRVFWVQPDPWDGAWWVVPSEAGESLADLRAMHEQLFSRVAAA